MKKKLTDKQQFIFNQIKWSIENKGYPPTLDELIEKTALVNNIWVTKKTISDYMKALEKKGYIVRDGRGARAIRLIGYSVKLIKDEPEEGIFEGYTKIEFPVKIIVEDYDRINFGFYFSMHDKKGFEKLVEIPDEIFNDKEIENFLLEEAFNIGDNGIMNLERDRQDEECELRQEER